MTGIEPRVLGWDLSMTASGLTMPDGQCFTIRPQLKGDLRLGEIREATNYYIRQAALPPGPRMARPTWLAVIEKPENIKLGGWETTVAIVMVHGIVRDELAQFGIPVVYIHPTTLKKYATGSGAASKNQMILEALECGSPENLTDNEADAWWLRAAGRHYYGLPVAPSVMLSRDVLFGPHATTKWPRLDGASPSSRATR